MPTPSSKVVKPLQAQLGDVYHGIRTHMLHAAANADEGTVRMRLAYVALWLLASASAVAYVTRFTDLFASRRTDDVSHPDL